MLLKPPRQKWCVETSNSFAVLTDNDADGELDVMNVDVENWLERNSGELVARHEFDGSGFYVEPVVADDRLIIVTRDGEVSAVKAP